MFSNSPYFLSSWTRTLISPLTSVYRRQTWKNLSDVAVGEFWQKMKWLGSEFQNLVFTQILRHWLPNYLWCSAVRMFCFFSSFFGVTRLKNTRTLLLVEIHAKECLSPLLILMLAILGSCWTGCILTHFEDMLQQTAVKSTLYLLSI